MIVSYPERKEAVSMESKRLPSEQMGAGNKFPDNEESIQRYERGSDKDHDDESMRTESPIDGEKFEPSVVRYPRGSED